MTLSEALQMARERHFKYFQVDNPRIELEEVLNAIANEGTPATVEYEGTHYLVLSLDRYYIYRFFGLSDVHSRLSEIIKDYMVILTTYTKRTPL